MRDSACGCVARVQKGKVTVLILCSWHARVIGKKELACACSNPDHLGNFDADNCEHCGGEIANGDGSRPPRRKKTDFGRVVDAERIARR